MKAAVWTSEPLPLEDVSPKGGLLQAPDSGVRKGENASLPPSASVAWLGGAGVEFQAWLP